MGRQDPPPGSHGRHRWLRGAVRRQRTRTYDHPVLATSTDGVGTKVAIAQALDRHDTIGFDLVGMVVDDLVVCGAEPLFMTDYIACGKVDPERIAAIVKGIAMACARPAVRCSAARPQSILDCSDRTSTTSPARRPESWNGTRSWAPSGSVRRRGAGHGVLRACTPTAIPWSGTYSATSGWALDRYVPELGQTLGEELLTPTRIYARDCLALIGAVEVHAMSHVTGGGLANNLARVIPASCEARIDRTTWQPPPIFGLIRATRRDLRARSRGNVQHGRRHGRGAAPRLVDEAYACSQGVGCGPGFADRCLPAKAGTREAREHSFGPTRSVDDRRPRVALHPWDHWVAFPSRH